METACDAWIDDKKSRNHTTPGNAAEKTTECGDREFWFLEGEDQGSYVELESANCDQKHEEWRTAGANKIYPPIGGPGSCGEKVHICNQSIVEDDVYYSTEGCGLAPRECGSYFGFKYPECEEHEMSEYMIKKCEMRPLPHGPKGGSPLGTKGTCSEIGAGRPGTNIDGWDSSPDCSRWAKCMGYYHDGEFF